jgi:hypothetical protein
MSLVNGRKPGQALCDRPGDDPDYRQQERVTNAKG